MRVMFFMSMLPFCYRLLIVRYQITTSRQTTSNEGCSHLMLYSFVC